MDQEETTKYLVTVQVEAPKGKFDDATLELWLKALILEQKRLAKVQVYSLYATEIDQFEPVWAMAKRAFLAE